MPTIELDFDSLITEDFINQDKIKSINPYGQRITPSNEDLNLNIDVDDDTEVSDSSIQLDFNSIVFQEDPFPAKKRKRARPGLILPDYTIFEPDYSKVQEDSRGFWDSISHAMVGEEAEWGEYWERGLGKSTFNLMLQYYSDQNRGYDYNKAFGVEPEDTGIAERFFETLVGIGADLIPFLAGSIPAGMAGLGPALSAGAGAFVNESIKTMYLEALERGDVDTFGEFFDIFVREGISAGVKSGATLAIAIAAPGSLALAGVRGNFVTDTLAQVVAMNAFGTVMNDHLPTKESVINDLLTFGAFNISGAGAQFAKRFAIHEAKTIKGRTNLVEILRKNLLRDPAKREGIYSLNPLFIPAPKGKPPKIEYGPQPQSKSFITGLKQVFKVADEVIAGPGKKPKIDTVIKLDTARARVLDNMKISDPVGTFMDKYNPLSKERRRTFQEEMIDKLYPVKEIVRRVDDLLSTKRDALGGQSPYELLRSGAGSINKATTAFTRGTFRFGDLKKIGKGLNDILFDLSYTRVSREGDVGLGSIIKRNVLGIKTKRVNKPAIEVKENFENFNLYLIARRGIEKYLWAKRTRSKNLKEYETKEAQEKLKDYYELKEKYKEYEKMANEIYKYQKEILDYVEASGIITKKTRRMIEEANKDYVPWNVVQEAGMSATGKGRGLKTWTGFISKRINLEAPVNSIYTNTLHLIALADRNIALKSFFDMVQKNPELVPEVKLIEKTSKSNMTQKEMDQLHLSEFGKLKEVEPGLEALKPDGFFETTTSATTKSAKISYFENGQKVTYSVEPRLYRSLAQSRDITTNLFIKISRKAAQTLRTGATLTPEFFLQNIMRDAYGSAAVSKNWHIPFVASAKGAAALIDDYLRRSKGMSGNEYVDMYLRTGNGQANFIEMNKQYLDPKMVTEFKAGREYHNEVPQSHISRVMNLLNTIGAFGENMARVGEFKITLQKLQRFQTEQPGFFDRQSVINLGPLGQIKVGSGYKKRHGMTEREMLERAGFEARDLIDFGKAGWTAESYNQLAAFFNARIRGYDKLASSVKNRPLKTLASYTLTMTVPSIGLWFLNHDDPAYIGLSEFEKTAYWNIPLHKIPFIGSNEPLFLKIPKPWEPGLLFGTGAEKMLDEIYDKDPQAVDDFLIDMGIHQIRTGLVTLPTFAQPLLENLANFSYFTGGPLIPESKKALLPEYRTRKDTSEIAKWLGKQIPSNFTSPIAIDNFIQGWTGGLGRNVMKMTSALIRGFDPKQDVFDIWSDDWVKNVNSIPIVKAFLVRSPKANSSNLTTFYKNLNKSKQTVATINRLKKEFKFVEMKKLMLTPEFLKYEKVKKLAATISQIQSLILMTESAPDHVTSDNDKRDIIDRYYRALNDLAAHANTLMKEVDE